MRVLHAAAEIYPLIKTGGLADVTAALPPAQAALGIDVRVLLPGLPDILAGVGELRSVASLGAAFGVGHITLRTGRLPGSGLICYVIDAPFLYARPGNPYIGPDGYPWSDNHLRFGLLGWIAAHVGCGGLDPDWSPDVVHAHDWHAALAASYLAARPGPRPASVFTIHNLAYQGLFDADCFAALGLPARYFAIDRLEFHGQLSFMKGGLIDADRITTVSPNYAAEILTPEFACGLGGVLNRRREALSGILNGVDGAIWNPAHDGALEARYSLADLGGKQVCKVALQSDCGLAVDADAPLFVVVSRLTQQKGLDLVVAGAAALLSMGGQLVVLGTGDAELERQFKALAQAHPKSVAVIVGYDEQLSHRIIAGGDVILVPSRFEPCGLTQLYGLRYGCLPLVRRIGGLADTVVDATSTAISADCATGFVFDAASVAGLTEAVRRACVLFRQRMVWNQLVRCAMRQDFSWHDAALHYLELYRGLRPQQAVHR